MSLILYDKLNNKIGELKQVKDAARREVLNNEYLISFVTLQHELYFDDIQEEAFIELDGQKFIIRKCNTIRRGQSITKHVEADHIYATLIDYYLDSYIDFQAVASIATLMNMIVADTPFSYVLHGVFENKDISDFGEINKLEALNYVQEQYEVELEFDNYLIKVHNQRGSNNGASFEYAKNMKSVERNVDSSNLITRLNGYGKDGLTIEGWNDHTSKYIDSQYINSYSYIKNGKFEDNSITDQEELYDSMVKYLQINEVPYVSYRVDIIELKNFNQPGQAFKVGDTVAVKDTVLGIDITARVVEYVEYPFEPNRSNVVLANFDDNAVDYIAKLDDAKRVLDRIFQNGKVQSKFLEAFITNASTKLNNAFSEIDVDQFGIIAISKTDPNKLVRFNAEGVGVSTDGGQTYRQAMTGDGINADVIAAGHILFNYIQSLDGHVLGDDKGLYVVDDSGIERLRIGQYETGKYGSKAVRADTKVRVIQDSANGFLIQKNTGTVSVPVWVDKIYADSNGNLNISGTITVEGGNAETTTGSQARVDALSSSLGNMAYEDVVEKAKLGTTMIQGGYLVTGLIDASRIDTGILNASRIGANSITADKINATNLHVLSANIDGILTANQINIKGTSISNNGQTTFAVDNNGNVTMMGNITMNGGNINWSNVTKPSYTAYEVGARPNTWTPTASQVGAISSTYIDANGIWTGYINADRITSGTISADRINGGTISGVTINVNTDVTVGNKLYLNANNFGNGIKWGTSYEIYIDPVGKSMQLSTPSGGGIYANGRRIDVDTIAKFG